MNFYSVSSKVYDLLDRTYFMEKGNNPRKVIDSMIPNSSVQILDLCCGTLSNTFSVAEKYPKAKIMGVDLSREMLTVARKKIKKKKLTNVYLKCADATNIDLKEASFDYIIIGLVLHECSPELRQGILKEADRLLKNDGFLILLEWEKQHSIVRKLKYAPLYLGEKINCKYFSDFFLYDKEGYLKRYQFSMVEKIHCNYSIVIKFKKTEQISK